MPYMSKVGVTDMAEFTYSFFHNYQNNMQPKCQNRTFSNRFQNALNILSPVHVATKN